MEFWKCTAHTELIISLPNQIKTGIAQNSASSHGKLCAGWHSIHLNLGAVAGIALAAVFASWFIIIGGYCIYQRLKIQWPEFRLPSRRSYLERTGQALDPTFGLSKSRPGDLIEANAVPYAFHPPNPVPLG